MECHECAFIRLMFNTVGYALCFMFLSHATNVVEDEYGKGKHSAKLILSFFYVSD